MSWDVDTQGTGPISPSAYFPNIKESMDQHFANLRKDRERELRKMKKSELINLILEIEHL